MEKERCVEAAALLLTAVTQEKQAQADQLRALFFEPYHHWPGH
ncbi:MAG: hypothetical protein ABIS84_02945 [Arachnia sp.]